MILDKLELCNFGVYGSPQQEFILTPKEKQPIVLFGALNGSGKTTLLDALQLVLFGRNAQLSNRKNLGYSEYLAKSIHRGAGADARSSIRLIFRHHSAGQTETLGVTRSWYTTKGGAVREQLEVTNEPYDDGEPDPVLTDAWADHVQMFMPANIAPLFFFDGEEIETLADMEHSADVLATAITSLLGLDVVDQLVTDLGSLERRKRSKVKDEGFVQMVRSAERDIDLAKAKYDDAFQQKAQAQNEEDKASKAVLEAERAYARQGGQALEERAALEAELKALQEQIEELETRLRDVASGAAPLLLVEKGLLGRVAEQDAREVRAAHASALSRVLVERDRELLRVAEKAGTAASVIEELRDHLNADRQARAAQTEVDRYLHLSDDARSQLVSLRTTSLSKCRQEASGLVARIDERRQRLEYLDKRLQAVPSSEVIDEALAARDTAREVAEAARLKLHGLSEEVARRKNELERLQKNLQREIEKQRRGELRRDDAMRLIRHSERIRGNLNVFRTRLVERRVQRIERSILESFRLLLRKQNLISALSIDPRTFAIELRGGDGRALAPERLSAGERQLLAVSMLWGLARASGRPLPAVIDTPLGRLDSEHRSHLVTRYFPYASHQVLLLSTDEEIDKRYYAQLEKFVARSYVLEFDEKLGATVGKDGYFWKT